MTRSRASAKTAGTRMETSIANCLAEHVDPRIERRVRHGARDTGDIAGVYDSHKNRVVIEIKDYGGRVQVGPWLKEAETERIHDAAEIGLVIFKRRGITDPMQQGVLMTVIDLITLLKGELPI